MDFRFCYEDGYKNHRNELSETDKAFMAGFKCAYNEIETFMANTDSYEGINREVSPTLSKVCKEIREDIINDLRDWLRCNWYETIISMIDEAEEGVQKNNDEYEIPEPLSEEKVTELEFEEE